VRRFSSTTRTAEDAAREIGTETERIVKSLVFMVDSRPIIVLCCGNNRVSLTRLGEICRTADVRRATADEVKRYTGFSIGGVPPFGHSDPIEVILDEDMARFATVWAAGGLPDAVFEIGVDDLARLSGARSAAVAAIAGTP
jgi:prolyl-tRNA editing enzyme YbaK/EbsC (Cys-tRNA(Pro) deacylase)